MATITTILASDIIASSRVTLNTNFANLNTDKVDINSTYADPAWITSLAGSKITGNIGGNAATATALATARTIAGVSFDGTANIAIPSSGLSDSSDIVRGASSVASGQVLYGTAAGVAGSEANLFWDATNKRFGVGTASPGFLTHFVGIAGTDSGWSRTVWQDATNATRSNWVNGVGFTTIGTITNDPFVFVTNNTDRARFAATTGNLLLGTTTDDGTNRLQVAGSVAVTTNIAATRTILSSSTAAPQIRLNVTGQSGYWEIYSDFNNTNADLWFRPNGTATTSSFTQVNSSGNWGFGTTAANTFKIDIASSGSSGTLRAYDQTPTTGVTQVIVRAGAGQSTTNLQTWQNAAGTTLARVEPTGRFVSDLAYDSRTDAFSYGTSAAFNSGGQITWGPNATTFYSPDVAIRRRADGVLEINNGTAGTFRDLFARGLRPVGSTVANLPAAAGNAGMLATVTDATVTTIGTTVAGGGGNTVLVWSNGTNWRIYAN
jgi:hypothetical protein